MITEQAIVTRYQKGRAELELQRGSVCAGCDLNQGCGTGALGRLLGRRSKPLVIDTQHELKPGDRLRIEFSETALVKISLTIYGLPLLGLVFGGLLTALAGASDGWVALVSLTGFMAGFKLASYFSRSLEGGLLAPHIVDIQVNPET